MTNFQSNKQRSRRWEMEKRAGEEKRREWGKRGEESGRREWEKRVREERRREEKRRRTKFVHYCCSKRRSKLLKAAVSGAADLPRGEAEGEEVADRLPLEREGECREEALGETRGDE